MAVRKILYLPDARLRVVAKPVVDFDDRLQELIDDMFETMYDAQGVGLAAPQIGVSLRLSVIDVSGDKRSNQADKNSDRRDDNGENHGIPSSRNTDATANDKSSTGGLSERSEEISTHSSHITDIISHIISNSSRVLGTILRQVLLDLTDEISTHISSLGENTSSDSAEKSHKGSSEAVASNSLE